MIVFNNSLNFKQPGLFCSQLYFKPVDSLLGGHKGLLTAGRHYAVDLLPVSVRQSATDPKRLRHRIELILVEEIVVFHAPR